MKYCYSCGKPIEEGDTFCPSCGTRLTPQAPVKITQPEYQQATKPKSMIPKVAFAIVGIIVVVGIVAFVIGGIPGDLPNGTYVFDSWRGEIIDSPGRPLFFIRVGIRGKEMTIYNMAGSSVWTFVGSYQVENGMLLFKSKDSNDMAILSNMLNTSGDNVAFYFKRSGDTIYLNGYAFERQ